MLQGWRLPAKIARPGVIMAPGVKKGCSKAACDDTRAPGSQARSLSNKSSPAAPRKVRTARGHGKRAWKPQPRQSNHFEVTSGGGVP